MDIAHLVEQVSSAAFVARAYLFLVCLWIAKNHPNGPVPDWWHGLQRGATHFPSVVGPKLS